MNCAQSAVTAAFLVMSLVAAAPAESLGQLVESLRQHPGDGTLRAKVKRQIRELREPGDAELLGAVPIPRARMELIWVEPSSLRELAAKVKAAGGRITTEFYDSADKDRREFEITSADIAWAQGVEKVVDFAYAAGQEERLEEAISFYKQALVLAPGGDLFLMSVGVAYVRLGQKERGLRFLERAARLSPSNGRIQKNLQAARGY
jgi:tetratricopeptide (TPR) repeat protein